MLLLLTEWIAESFLSAFNVFGYITLRSAIALLTSLFMGLWFGPMLIRKLTQLKCGQSIRQDGPSTHLSKQGIPTMGGLLILIAVTISTLLWADLSVSYIWITLSVTLIYGAIGAVDDWKKIKYRNSKGLSVKVKFFWQSVIAIVVSLLLLHFTDVGQHTSLVLPIFKNIMIPLGYLGFMIMYFFVVVGSSNGVNLTDGLDGLAIMPVILVSAGLAVFSYVSGNSIFAQYLAFPYIANTGELVVFLAALIGAGLAFLWFNAHPAQVFMGDIGSLSIGAALGTVAIIIRQEIILFIMGGLFVLESLSVLIQVGYFKYSRRRYGKGRRVFLMAPLHHHFEQKGWKETKIVIRFWILSIIFVLIGLSLLKLR